MASASLSGFSMTGWNAQSFRPQLPIAPVVYPPCCGKGPTFRYFLQSKILALAFLILAIALFVSFVCAFLPYWFILKFNILDSTFGSEGLRSLKKDTGIIFYTDDDYISLLSLEKVSNRQVVPPLFKMAQVMEVLSVAAVALSCAGSGILAFRKFASVTGVLFLAALGTLAALGQLLMVIFAAASMLSSANDVCEILQPGCQYGENQVWRNLPFREQFRRINQHTTPQMEANWAFYIAMISAALTIAGCVLLWIEGLMVCRSVGKIRYQQLSQKRDVYEHEREPTDFIRLPPARALAPAQPPVMYGFQPGGVSYAPPRQTYRPPPSMSGASSTEDSGSVVRYPPPGHVSSRQIDL